MAAAKAGQSLLCKLSFVAMNLVNESNLDLIRATRLYMCLDSSVDALQPPHSRGCICPTQVQMPSTFSCPPLCVVG